MKNVVYGYARVSTSDQNLDRQLDALERHGVDRIFSEKMTGTKRERPELETLLDRLTEGDRLVVESLSRLARSTRDLLNLSEQLQAKKVNLVSLKESIDTGTPTGRFLFIILAAISEFERDCIVERSREGLEAARARGRVGGRPRVDAEKMKQALRLYRSGKVTIKEIREVTGITKPTLYRYLHEGA